MKKAILIALVAAMIAVMGVSLSACNNATTQGQLQNILNDHNHESFEYSVFAQDADGNRVDGYDGTYAVTLDKYVAGSTIENFGSATLSDVAEGILVKGNLTVGTTEYNTGCYFTLINGSSYMVPAYSFRTVKKDGNVTFSLNATYDGKKFNYNRTIDGVESNGTVDLGKAVTYYDNNEFHQSLRTITTFSESLSFSFAMPVVSDIEASSVTLTARVGGKATIKNTFTESRADFQDSGISCYKTLVSRSTEVAGLSQTLFYSVNDVTFTGWSMKHVLVRIQEPFKVDGNIYSMVYDLKSAELH